MHFGSVLEARRVEWFGPGGATSILSWTFVDVHGFPLIFMISTDFHRCIKNIH